MKGLHVRKLTASTLALLHLCATASAITTGTENLALRHTAEQATTSTRDVVTIYFPGFHPDRNYEPWFGYDQLQLLDNAKPRYPDQYQLKPAWGNFDETRPEWMEKQIDLAADYGVTVMMFDWYWYSGVKILNRPLEEAFLKCPNRERLKYCLMWANHDWNEFFPAPLDRSPDVFIPIRHTARDFERHIEYCIQHHFRQPNYWRVHDGPLFALFSPDQLIDQLGGTDKARAVITQARRQVADAGLGRLHLMALVSWAGGIPKVTEADFDSVSRYGYPGSLKCSPERPVGDYGELMEWAEGEWPQLEGILPACPNVSVGWDATSRWHPDMPAKPTRWGWENYPYWSTVVNNTPERFGELCRKADTFLKTCKSRSMPGFVDAIIVNAWNEWPENSSLLPEVKYGTRFLEEMQKALYPAEPAPVPALRETGQKEGL